MTLAKVKKQDGMTLAKVLNHCYKAEHKILVTYPLTAVS